MSYFVKLMEKLMSKTNKILNFHVFLKKNSKIEDKHMRISNILFKKVEKMQKLKSNTFKKINNKNFVINAKIDV